MGTNINLGYRAIHSRSGFTLIELSIVLVVIGLVIGSILVGQDLIAAATARAQVSQIEKYNTAVNTFKGKYNGLPGDLPDPAATTFGFTSRGTASGEGDGNGLIQGCCTGSGGQGAPSDQGELATFWIDLSQAGLIDAGFSVSTNTQLYTVVNPVTATSTPNFSNYFPQAKIGNGNYILVWNGTLPGIHSALGLTTNGNNYWEIEIPTSMSRQNAVAWPGMTVAQAYGIDKKMDDGLPQSGSVVAVQTVAGNANNVVVWAEGGGPQYGGLLTDAPKNMPFNYGVSVTSGSSVSCFDFNGNLSNTAKYSIETSSGENINCALTLQFQ